MGYKSVPILTIYRSFNLVKGMVTDYLHCVLLGVTKMLTELWFLKNTEQKSIILEIRLFTQFMHF